MNEQRDWVEATRRAVPVLVMVAGFLGFVGALYKWLALGQTPDTGTMGICALAASGGYFASALVSALKSSPPPTPPASPKPEPAPDP